MAGDELKSTTELKPASVKVFNCPICGAGVVLRAAGQSVTAVCGSCAAIIDTSNENYKFLQKASNKGKRDQVIPLGQRGKFRGVVWEVIGYVERSDGTSVYTWSEYLLFNPLKGFRWLTEFDGHWNYVVTTKTKPSQIHSKRVIHLNKSYHLFHKGLAKVSFVVGEFYWQVKNGETVKVEDYVSPPEILSSEKSNNEIVWSLGEYVSSSEVKSSFQIAKLMPLQSGVAPNHPSTITETANYAAKYWGIFLGVLFLIQFGSVVLSKNKTVYSGQFTYSSTDTGKLKVTPQFEVAQGMSNLEVIVSSPVQNNWIEVQSDLVNDDTGETEEFEQGVEYYSGYDSGSWSEGSQISSFILSSVPSGKYHLNIEASGPALRAPMAAVAEQITTPMNAIPKMKIENWPNGKLMSVEPILNGKIEGIAKYYHDNGQPYSEIPYHNGEKHGKFKLFRPDGSIDQELSYLNGKLNGSSKWYDSGGNVSSVANYVDGNVVANDNSSGEVTLNVVVKRGVTIWSNFFWALFLISFFPILVLWRKRSFEMKRWSQSDFSPYYDHQEEN